MLALVDNGDPLFNHGLSLAVWVILLVKVVIIFALVLLSVLFMVMYERKAVAWLGMRYGPNRAGPNGWLQSLADGTKLFFKEAFLPVRADKLVYKAAPFIALVPPFVAFSVIPLGGTITVAHHTTRLQLADPPFGVLLVLAASGVAVYGVMLAGWSSGSKYPLLASVRATAQMVSYEAVLGLTVASVVLETGSLHTSAIWVSQHGPFLLHWNIVRTGFIPFFLFCIALTAEMTRPPFDLVEAEEELAGGFNMEYSSASFALFYLAEYANLIVGAAFITTLWLGGPDGPAIAGHHIGPFWFAVKVLILLYIFVWVRATLPRMRYDQLMELCWKRLIPLALAMLMIDAGFQVSRKWTVVTVAGAILGLVLLWRAIDVGKGASRVEADYAEAKGAKSGTR
jgi:NADH-quinone oxidoreductase subunit H